MAKKTARKTCWTTARSHSSLVGGRLTACGSRIMMRWPPPFSSTSTSTSRVVGVAVGGHDHPNESPGKGNTPAWNEKALPPPPPGPKGALISSAGSAPPPPPMPPMWAASSTANGFRNAGARKEGAGGGGAAGRGRGGMGRDLGGVPPRVGGKKRRDEEEGEEEEVSPSDPQKVRTCIRGRGGEDRGNEKEGLAYRGSTASAEV